MKKVMEPKYYNSCEDLNKDLKKLNLFNYQALYKNIKPYPTKSDQITLSN